MSDGWWRGGGSGDLHMADCLLGQGECIISKVSSIVRVNVIKLCFKISPLKVRSFSLCVLR